MFAVGILTSLLLAIASAAPALNISETHLETVDAAWIGEGIIPVSRVGCWEDLLHADQVKISKEKLQRWGLSNPLRIGSWHGEEYGLAGVWVCNCKHFRKDHVIAAELNEAERLIAEECGENRSGWVWSWRWQKSFNFGTARRMGTIGQGDDKCPPFCLWNPYEKNKDY